MFFMSQFAIQNEIAYFFIDDFSRLFFKIVYFLKSAQVLLT